MPVKTQQGEHGEHEKGRGGCMGKGVAPFVMGLLPIAVRLLPDLTRSHEDDDTQPMLPIVSERIERFGPRRKRTQDKSRERR